MIELLEQSLWLSRSAPHLAGRIAQEGRVLPLPAGAWSHSEGDEETGLLVVLAGELHIYCQAPGDREVLIGRVGPGGAIGQAVRLGGGPRLVTAISAGPSRILVVGDAALGRIGRDDPAIWQAVASLSYLQMSGMIRHLAEMIALPPRQRLAARIAALAAAQSGKDRHILHLVQKTLAEMTGLTRKTVNSFLHEFERAGLLRRSYGRIQLLDRAGLIAVADEGA